jgi:hypothetical protein
VTTVKAWIAQQSVRGHVTSVPQRRHATIEALLEVAFFRLSDRGFIGETEARLRSQFSVGDSSGRFVVEEDLNMWIEDFVWAVVSRVGMNNSSSSIQEVGLWKVYVWIEVLIYVQYLECETVVVSVLRSVARRRLVETGNPSACATVCCKVCKAVRGRCCLYLSVIKSECVTNC